MFAYRNIGRRRLMAAGALVLAAAGAGTWYFKGGAQGPRAGGPPPAVVAAATPRVGTVSERFETVGSLLANEAITVTARDTGIVTRVMIEPGALVAQGAVLAELDDREVRADLEAARATRSGAQLAYDRVVALGKGGNAPQSRIDEVKSQRDVAEARVRSLEAKLQDLKITAPFAGRVGLRRVSVGALVQPGSVITTLDDTASMRLSIKVPERLLASLATGADVTARSDIFPGRVFSGRIEEIDSRIDPQSRMVEMHAKIPNGDGVLKPGMFVALAVESARRENALLVPEGALIPEGDRQFAFKVLDGKAKRVEVTIGLRQGGEVEVLTGLAAGDVVVTEGTQKIQDGAPVQVSGSLPAAA